MPTLRNPDSAALELHLREVREGLLYFRAFLRFVIIEHPNGIGPLLPWPHLLWLADLWQAGESHVILKSRRLGLTWLGAAFILWKITHPGVTVIVLSQGEEEAKEIIRRVKFIYNHLPQSMQDMMPVNTSEHRTKGGIWNKSEIALSGFGRALALASTEKAGRSFTASVVVVDEAAFHKNAARDYAAYRPTIEGGGQILMFSTGNGEVGDGKFFHDLFWQAFNGNTPYRAIFLDWKQRPGRDRVWYETEEIAYMSDPERGSDAFRAEYPNSPEEAFVALTDRVFPMFNRQTHIRPPLNPWHECELRYIGVDFGGSSPTAAVAVGMTMQGAAHVYGEFYLKGATLEDLGYFFTNWHMKGPLHRIECDYNEEVSVKTLHGMGFPAFRANKDRGYGYRILRSMFNQRSPRSTIEEPWGRLTLDPSLRHLPSEIVTVRFERRPGESEWKTSKPDHALDALRYAVVRGINNREVKNFYNKPAYAGVQF